METTFFRSFPKKFEFVSLCSFIMSAGCVSTFRTCVQGYLEWLPFVFCFSPFTSRFVIDFLSIRKVIIFSAIATDDRHPLRSRSIHQNAANCMTIRFRYIAQPRGHGCFSCASRIIKLSHPYFRYESGLTITNLATLTISCYGFSDLSG